MQALVAAGLPPLRFFDRVAGTICPLRNAVDERGKSREDYQQDLIEYALRRAPRVFETHASPRVLAQWTWRRARAFRRDRECARQAQVAHEALAPKVAEVDPFPHLENRACVRHLETRMSGPDLRVVALVAEHGISEGARLAQVPYLVFASRTAQAMSTARALLSEETTMTETTDPYANIPDAQILQQAPCFGTSFSKADAECSQCGVRARCVSRIVKVSIPDLIAQRGVKEVTPELFLEHFESEDVDTAQHLVAIFRGQRTLASVLAPTTEEQAPPKEEPTTESEEAQPEDPTEGAEPTPEPTPEPKAASEAPKVKKKPPKVAPAKEKKPPKEKVAKAKKEKKEKKEKKPAKAPPVKKSSLRQWSSEADIKKRIGKAKPPKAGDADWSHLWQQERDRTPAVAALTPGTKIARYYCGVLIEVVYQKGHVEFGGAQWPTLASVKNAIVEKKEYPASYGSGKRTMTNWSVPRFFQLVATKAGKKKARKS